MPVRAAMLTPNLSMGGAERWLTALIAHSDPRRLQWTGVALSGWGGRDPALCRELSQHVSILAEPRRGSLADPQTIPYVVELASLREALAVACHNADVLVTWGGFNFGHLLPREMPVVLVGHNTTSKQLPLGPAQGITHLAAVCEAAVAPLAHPGNPPVTVLYNGVDTARLKPTCSLEEIHRDWGILRQELVIGYIGRFSPEKNPDAALRAARHLQGRWHAVYYGERPPHIAPKDCPVRSRLSHDGRDPRFGVHIRPPLAQIGNVYQALDVLMLASHTEAFSLTMIEAWLTGVAVVATPVGAVEELERAHGPLVTRVPLRPTSRELADACRSAISHKGRAIATRAKEIAWQHWTAPAMASRWAAYLEQVVCHATPPLAAIRLGA